MAFRCCFGCRHAAPAESDRPSAHVHIVTKEPVCTALACSAPFLGTFTRRKGEVCAQAQRPEVMQLVKLY